MIRGPFEKCARCGAEDTKKVRVMRFMSPFCGECFEVAAIMNEIRGIDPPGSLDHGDRIDMIEAMARALRQYRHELQKLKGPTKYTRCACGWSQTDADFVADAGVVKCVLCGREIGPEQ